MSTLWLVGIQSSLRNTGHATVPRMGVLVDRPVGTGPGGWGDAEGMEGTPLLPE